MATSEEARKPSTPVSDAVNGMMKIASDAETSAQGVGKAMTSCGVGAVTGMAGTVADAASCVRKEVSTTASQMATSAAQLSQNAQKDGGLADRMWKPLLIAAGYQYAQECYTATWPEDNAIWRETTIWKPVFFTILYLAMIFGGKRFMASRTPTPRIRKYMLTYNLYQVILNAWCVGYFIYEIAKNHAHPFNLTVADSSYKLSFLVWVHYNNKFIELLDTMFMVFNKKDEQISFLHVYHHVLLMWSWWAVCCWGCGGISWFSAMMNSFIHVLMYGYYLLAALKIPCPWKKVLTKMQMAQFVMCMSTALYALYYNLYPLYLSLLNIWVMMNMLVLFGNFYRKRYAAAKKPEEKPKTA